MCTRTYNIVILLCLLYVLECISVINIIDDNLIKSAIRLYTTVSLKLVCNLKLNYVYKSVVSYCFLPKLSSSCCECHHVKALVRLPQHYWPQIGADSRKLLAEILVINICTGV